MGNRIKSFRCATACISLLSALFCDLRAEDAEQLAKLDLNGDRALTEWEVKVGIQYRMSKADSKAAKVDFKALHKKLKGKQQVTEKDVGTLSKELTSTGYAFFKAMYGAPSDGSDARYPLNGRTYRGPSVQLVDIIGNNSLPDVTQDPENTTSRYTWDKPVVKVRRAVEDLKKDDLKTVQAAVGSYAHNFREEGDVWSLRGIVASDFVWRRNRNFEKPAGAAHFGGVRDPETGEVTGLEWLSLTPSVAFDKVTSQKDAKDELDSLIFRLGMGAMYQNGGAIQQLWESHIIETRISYATDFSLGREVFAGEFDFSPIKQSWTLNSGFHGFPRIEFGQTGQPWFKYRWLFTIHAEGGTVGEADNDPTLEEKEDFLRIGPIIGLRIVPAALTNLSLNLTYRWFAEISGEHGNTDLFNASLEWDITRDGHFVLTTEYQYGKTPLLLQRDNSLVLGLGVKF